MLNDSQKLIAERFKQLPLVVQSAITSADVEKRLRNLAGTQKLHIDQWDKLQTEVTFTLLGFQEPEELSRHLASALSITTEEATSLASAINTLVFEPIRQELERALTHPEAKEVQTDGIEKARQAALSLARASGEATPAAVQAATPPAQKPEGSVVRAPLSETYKPSVPSSERKAVDGDPYRELPV